MNRNRAVAVDVTDLVPQVRVPNYVLHFDQCTQLHLILQEVQYIRYDNRSSEREQNFGCHYILEPHQGKLSTNTCSVGFRKCCYSRTQYIQTKNSM